MLIDRKIIMNKVVLITGTSSGVGLAFAVQMVEQGFNVFATKRNLEKADELKKQIAILINNAGSAGL